MKQITHTILALLLSSTVFSQTDTTKHAEKCVFYTLLVNVVPDEFNYPLLGLVNVATGNHNNLQIGAVNTTLKDYKTVQIGGVNTNLQTTKGVQIGFVNTSVKQLSGVQIGGINISKKLKKGLQLGFVNYADTVEYGLPIGFVSVIKKGGYRFLDISTTTLTQLSLSYKIGVPKFYTIWQLDYNNNFPCEIGTAFGIGSIIPLKNKFYLNNEARLHIFFLKGLSYSYNAKIGYNITNKIQMATGASVAFSDIKDFEYSWLAFFKNDFMALGACVSISFKLK